MKSCISFFHEVTKSTVTFRKYIFFMKLKAFEAHFFCGHFAPKNFKNGSVVKKLSPKNLGVGIKLVDTVY